MSRMMRLSARGPDSIENSARIRHSPRFEASRRNPVNGSTRQRAKLSVASGAIPAAELNLVALDLTAPNMRKVIVANVENSVTCCQLFRTTFNAP